MKYLFDSDAVNIFYDSSRKAHHEVLHRKIGQLKDEDRLQTSVLVVCELEYSFYNAPDAKKGPIRKTLDSMLGDFDVILPVELGITPIYGELKALLKNAKNLDRKEMRKHNIDIILASTAIHTTSILIGMDKLYQDIAKLHTDFHFENWLTTTR
ncbi:MAG: type II toxin-antitoxin system VapC family toxin [bacterium]|nr:type II toxin-antitoxin system VapC family toxin [bacterium]